MKVRLIVGMACVLGFFSVTSRAETIAIATGEWLPYVSEHLPHNGPLGHLIETIFKRANIEVSYGYFPWARGYQLVKEGRWDATMPYYCSGDRQQDFECGEPIVEGQMVFFHRKDMAFDWTNFEQLSNYTIGGTLGYFYGEEFDRAEKSGVLKVHRVAKDESNFLVLARGRIDLFPQDKAVGYAMIRQLFNEQQQALLTHHPKTLHSDPLHLIFPKSSAKTPRYLAIFTAGLTQMRASGELERYLKAMNEGVYERGGTADNWR